MFMSSRNVVQTAAAALMFLMSGASLAMSASDDARVKSALDLAYAKVVKAKGGKNADYIPALAKVDSNIFGIALVTVDGHVYTMGDVKSEVSIQSISKVFTLALVMEQQSPDAIEKNMGVDATGQAFNSIVAIEQYKGAEMNPLVNPGAIAATSMVKGDTPRGDLEEHPLLLQRLRGPSPEGQRGSLQVGIRNQPAQPGHRRADVCLWPHQGQSGARHRHLHRAMRGERQCEGSGDHGRDARQWRQESGHRQSRHEGRERARSAGGHGDGRPLRRFRQMALPRPACRPRAASAAASSPWCPASSASRRSRRRSTPPATASRRSSPSRKSTRLSAPIPTP